MRKYFKIILMSFLPVIAFSATNQANLYFKSIDGKQGLSENMVNDIVQDQNGFIWMATNDGLNRYDGYSMIHYRYDAQDPNSISSNVLHSLAVAKDSTIWIGTSEGGLNQFNPKSNTFRRFKHNPADPATINPGIIDQIVEDTQGNIWVKVRGQGIDRLIEEDGTSRFLHYNTHRLGEDYIPVLKNNYIEHIEASAKGGIWIASADGIQHVIANSGEDTDLSQWDINYKRSARRVIEFDSNKIWIIYSDGEIAKGSIDDDFKLSINEEIETGIRQPINSVDVDGKGNLWIATNTGLGRVNSSGEILYQEGKRPFNNLPTNSILSLIVDNNNVLWLGTLNYGALYHDIDKETTYSLNDININNLKGGKSLLKNAIYSICQDNYGAIWFGTEGGGIVRIREGVDAFQKGIDAHIDYFSVKDNNTNWLTSDIIYSMYCDSKGRIWIGSTDGISVIEIKDNYNNEQPLTSSYMNIRHYPSGGSNKSYIGGSAVFYITEDFEGRIWLASWTGGLHRFIEKEERFETYIHEPAVQGSLSHTTIRCILFEPNGEAWIGTAGGGLNKMIFPEGKDASPYFISYKNDPGNPLSISNDYVLNLAKDKEGNLWIGTFGGGLNKMAINDSASLQKTVFYHYTTDKNLPNNTIKSLLFDQKGFLWATTNRNLFKMDVNNGDVTLFDGLIPETLDEFKDNTNYLFPNGYLMFGGINGLLMFSQDGFIENENPLSPTITNILVDNSPVQPGENIDGRILLKNSIHTTEKITLPYNRNTVSLEFSGMHFSDPQGVNYRYRLEGYDDDWTITKRRYAGFTKIPPGKYTFHIQASTENTIWNGPDKQLQITILPPLWRTPAAYVIYSIIFIITIYVLFKLMTLRFNLLSKVKIEQIKREQAEKTNNLKLQFFTNISHELKTPLSLIIYPIENLLCRVQENSEEHKMLHILQRNSIRLQNLINQLLDFRKIESGTMQLSLSYADIIPFVYDIFKAFEELAESKSIKYRFSCSETNLECFFDPDKIEKIIYNLVSNAIKFTPAGQTIVLSLSRDKVTLESNKKEEVFIIRVMDTGVGIKQEDQEKIFQRFYQSGNIEDEKNTGSGIGLAYTSNLVNIHRGKIELESEVRGGSTFTVQIPLNSSVFKENEFSGINVQPNPSTFLEDKIKGLEKSVIPAVLKAEDEKQLKDSTLLIVEDNSELVYFLKTDLEKIYNVFTAPNGMEGIQKAKDIIPDLIISDLMMPEMNGIEMCQILKTEIETCHIPIIILTAKSDDASEKEGLETGADEYLLKPIKIELLKLRIQNLIKTKNKLYERYSDDSDRLKLKEAIQEEDEAFIEKIREIILQNLDDNKIDVETLCRKAGISRSGLYKNLKRITDMSTTEFIRFIKLNEALKLIKQGVYTIEQVTFMVGFSDSKYFRKCFKKVFNKMPSEVLREVKGKI